jgi:uncharacterized membrane protein YhaH (DUF805 family)
MKNLKKIIFYYSNFSGKAGRLEYSVYFILNFISYLGILYLNSKKSLDDKTILYLFYICLIFLLKLIPMMAAATRRLRDLNLNTGLVIIVFIPILNLIFEIFLMLKKGKNSKLMNSDKLASSDIQLQSS